METCDLLWTWSVCWLHPWWTRERRWMWRSLDSCKSAIVQVADLQDQDCVDQVDRATSQTNSLENECVLVGGGGTRHLQDLAGSQRWLDLFLKTSDNHSLLSSILPPPSGKATRRRKFTNRVARWSHKTSTTFARRGFAHVASWSSTHAPSKRLGAKVGRSESSIKNQVETARGSSKLRVFSSGTRAGIQCTNHCPLRSTRGSRHKPEDDWRACHVLLAGNLCWTSTHKQSSSCRGGHYQTHPCIIYW